MKSNIKAEWVNRLRSGRYQQGYTRLRSCKDGENLWCCLGVLCDIYVDRKLGKWIPINKDGSFLFSWTGPERDEFEDAFTSETELVDPLLDYAELSKYSDSVFLDPEDPDCNESLVSLNDENRKSFEYIATWIEQNL